MVYVHTRVYYAEKEMRVGRNELCAVTVAVLTLNLTEVKIGNISSDRCRQIGY